jgi:hypothetical protein
MMQIHSSKSFFKQKRSWLIAAVIVITLVGVVWVAASVSAHNEAMKAVKQRADVAKDAAKHIAPDSKADNSERLAAIKTLSTLKPTKVCRGEWWNSWYGTVLPAAKKSVQNCTELSKRIANVSNSASRLDAYLESDTKIARTLAIIKVANGSNEWQKTAASSAESAQRDLDAITSTKDTELLLATSKERVEAIINGWSALNTASAAQDKDAYLKAEDELVQSYANLGAISDISDERVRELVAALQIATNTL